MTSSTRHVCLQLNGSKRHLWHTHLHKDYRLLLSYVLVCAITTRTWLLAFCHKMTENSPLLSLSLRDDRPAICAFLAVFFRPYGAPLPPPTLSNVTMATALHHHHLHPQQHTSTPRVADCVTTANDKLAVISSKIHLSVFLVMIIVGAF